MRKATPTLSRDGADESRFDHAQQTELARHRAVSAVCDPWTRLHDRGGTGPRAPRRAQKGQGLMILAMMARPDRLLGRIRIKRTRMFRALSPLVLLAAMARPLPLTSVAHADVRDDFYSPVVTVNPACAQASNTSHSSTSMARQLTTRMPTGANGACGRTGTSHHR